MVFEKTLTDLVKGIRASKRDTALYISSCIAEIKSEINSTDLHTKANALQKLTFLQMMGYNMSWASFATIEVMSSPRFAHKRIGYLAASQAFTQDTDVILLTTNTLKKELRGAVGPGMNGVYEAGLAINCLSNIVTEDLARELLGDITNLTVHPQPYLRKKAILCLLKIFMKYPHALRLAFPRIQDCLLKDTNSSVTSCAVNVITELSEVNPKNYLVLAPSFFELLTSSSNNWMLIKVVKLFGTLVPEEPRLARKLLEPLGEIVKNTQAKSLLYEAVYTVTLCLPYCRKADGSMPSCVPTIVGLCAETLKSFVEETDQNLKYLGLVGFGSLMISHPKVLSAPGYRPLILACLSDEDVTIRTRALDLLIGLATSKNIMDLVTQLLHHVEMASGDYRIDLVEKIVEICSSEKYSLITDFAWYIDVLVILAKTKGLDGNGVNKRNLGPLISNQISDVTLRVLPVRPYSVRRMIGIILDGGKCNNKGFLSGTFGLETNATVMPEALPVAAFIVGEYSTSIDEAVAMTIEEGDDDGDELFEYNHLSKGTYHALVQALTDPSNIDMLAHQTQSIYMHAAMKVFAASTCSSKCHDVELEASIKTLSTILPAYMQSMDTEVQERSFTSYNLMKSLGLIQTLSSLETSHKEIIDEESNNTNGILLNLANDSETPKEYSQKLDNKITLPCTISNSFMGTTVSKARASSSTLRYLLISEQMKPVSSKAQRRKRASAPAHINSILGTGNLNFLQNLLKNERKGDRSRGNASMDSVTFSQQLPTGLVSDYVSNIDQSGRLRISNESARTDPVVKNGDIGRYGFQAESESSASMKHLDPFYLDSHIKVDDNNIKPLNRFDTIQLLDAESDDSNAAKKRKKKKKSKKKQTEELSGLRSALSSVHNPRGKLPAIQQSLVDSDDEDDNGPNPAILRPKEKVPSTSSKNLLANIDLTTPLREDEFIPEPKHRVVPEYPKAPSTIEGKMEQKRTKKEKKSKTIKKHQTRVNNSQDLLDLANIGNVNIDTSSSLFSLSQPTNPINDAFDDLLSLNIQAPAPAPPLPLTTDPHVESFSRSGTLEDISLWQRASLKSSTSTSHFDWNTVLVFYVVHPKKDNYFSLSLKLRNVSATNALSDITISLPGIQNLLVNEISPHKDVQIDDIGPFSSASTNIKGSLGISGQSSKLRISLPYSINMSPLDLHNDQVADLLGNGEWTNESCKVDIPVAIDGEELIIALQHFLSASTVTGSRDESSFMLASKANSGNKAIFLIKKNKRTVKLDLKATDKTLAKALSSDLKKISFIENKK